MGRRGLGAAGRSAGTRACGPSDGRVQLGLVVGDPDVAREYHERALALRARIGDQAAVAASLRELSDVAYQVKDYGTSEQLLSRSLAIHEALGLADEAAVDRVALGFVARDAGHLERAAALLEEGLSRARQEDDLVSLSHAQMMLAELFYMQGEFDRAETLLIESVEISRKRRSSWGISVGLANRTVVAVEQGRLREAAGFCTEAISVISDSDAVRASVACLVGAAAVTAAEGKFQAAGRLLGARESLGDFALGPFAVARDRAIARATALISAETFNSYVDEGRKLTRERALSEALATLAPST